ncbi:uncharacterized protein LOC126267232 [Schistocerca gregaria]|uniref:uncharacterized protein LOC126267232 n=1 Tax=Schistocerca gregaria TaxID=7010 RepID=UPI00211DC03F|nr:uncharacterized protein LOC126267232 [Schistocerca gregaria]
MKQNPEIDSLAFADDLTIFSDSMEAAERQINEFNVQAHKTGLQISFQKNEVIMNINSPPRELAVGQGKIKRVEKFKYLGEWITATLSEKEVFISRMNKMKMAFHLFKNIYNKRSVSFNEKLRHYCSAIRPEVLCTSECLAMNKNGLIEKLEAKERKTLRKILGPIKENGEYRRHHNHELCSHIEKITDTIQKRRIVFHGHMTRMSPGIVINCMITYFQERKTKWAWFTEVEKGVKEMGIIRDDILEHISLKEKLMVWQGLQEKSKMKTGKAWTRRGRSNTEKKSCEQTSEHVMQDS